jgi:electron transport complex protein RnfE
MTVRLIGLCPLLAVSNTTLKASAIGILLGAVIIVTASITAALRYCVSWRLKPMYHALIASFTTACVVAYASIGHDEMVAARGVYPALIASNCLVLSFMQEVAERKALAPTVWRGLRDVAAVVVFLGLFGAIRELSAYGSMFTDSALMLGIHTFGAAVPTGPIPLMAGAPGALLALALVLAGTNAVSQRRVDRSSNRPFSEAVGGPDPIGENSGSESLLRAG